MTFSRVFTCLWSHRVVVGIALAAVVALAVVRGCNRGRDASAELKRRDEGSDVAGKLQAAGSGAAVATRSEKALAAAYVAALARADGLEAELARVRAAAPGARLVAVVQASTGGVVAGGEPRSSSLAPVRGGDQASGEKSADSLNRTGAPQLHGECLLAVGDTGDLRAAAVVLQTKGGNRVLTGTLEAWRLSPGPETRILHGPMNVETFVEQPAPGQGSPGWGIGPLGIFGRHGWMAGPLLSPPPLRLPWLGWRVDTLLGGTAGPGGEWAGTMGAIVRP